MSAGGQSTPSRASNEAAYGTPQSNADILNGKVAPPEAYNDVIQALISIEKVAIRWGNRTDISRHMHCIQRWFQSPNVCSPVWRESHNMMLNRA